MAGESNFTTAVSSGLDSHTGGSPYGFSEAVNLLATTLDGAHDDSTTTLTVASTTGFPTRGIVVVDSEVITYTGTTATTFTGCTRGSDNTSAAAHSDGATVASVPVAKHHNDLAAAVVALENAFVALSQPVGIINGNFNIWQRGTSFAAIANGAYSADRWFYGNTSAAVHTISRSTDVPAVAAQSPLQNYSMLVDCTTADTSVAAGDLLHVTQRIEGFNFLPYAQRQFTLSFWVKATKTGTYCVSFRNSTSDRSYVAEYTVNSSDTWEYKTVTVSASPSAGTWDYTTGLGLSVAFALAGGSTYQTTAGAWQSGNYLATANQVNAADSTSNDFRLAMVQLDLGPNAYPFRTRPIGQEEALCKRYYEELGGDASTEFFSIGQVTAATQAIGVLQYTPKRVAPTITSTSATDFAVLNAAASSSFECSALSFSPVSRTAARWVSTHASGTTAGDATSLRADTTTDARIKISAEL